MVPKPDPQCPVRPGDPCSLCYPGADGPQNCGLVWQVMQDPELQELDAIVAANEQMALGAMRALTDAGRSVPGDVSVVGFDDIEDSQEYQPPLTTIHQHFDEIGSRALAALIDRIADRDHRVDESVPTTLMQRASSAAVAPRRS